jgi:hypothetical protein
LRAQAGVTFKKILVYSAGKNSPILVLRNFDVPTFDIEAVAGVGVFTIAVI